MKRPQTPIVFKQQKQPVRPPIGPRMAARRPGPPVPRPIGTGGRRGIRVEYREPRDPR